MAEPSTFALSRRAFLSGVAAAAVVPALSVVSVPAAPAAAATAVPEIMPMFACGTPDAFDWQAFAAHTPEDAFRQWLDHQGIYDAEERAYLSAHDRVLRVAKWDGRRPEELKPVDWIKAGLGAHCDRCGEETFGEYGAMAVGNEVVCEECLTFADKVYLGGDDAVDELAEVIADNGEEEAKAALASRGDWDVIPEELWQRAIKQAEEYANG
ncbi:hypothetical protein V3589_02765 [Sinorhizobium fredii]|uniref:hypothetical protein n=1 Tax=Rhizobium fredii TaxID=380 RepID=UPI0030A367EA